MPRAPQDPYAPPPRHRDGSGAVVRFALVAAMLGAAAWGYMAYRDQPQTALAPPEATDLADRTYEDEPTEAPTVPAEPADAADPPA